MIRRARQAVSLVDHCLFHSLLEHLRWKIHDDIVDPTRRAKRCVDAKINTLESEGKYSPSSGKSTKRASQFDLIDKG